MCLLTVHRQKGALLDIFSLPSEQPSTCYADESLPYNSLECIKYHVFQLEMQYCVITHGCLHIKLAANCLDRRLQNVYS